ncbi:MAG: hypothetical protein ACFFE4_00440 [Candidatus Thorarchaeota archaeon]
MGNNIKFFKKNVIDSDASFSFTSANTNLASYLYDRDNSIQLSSSGSNDSTPEVWEITFASTKTIDRVLVLNHNIKSGELKYWTGAAWASFTSAISWSGNSATHNYYEVTQVSTLKLQLTMNTTIVADAEKSVGQLIACENIGEVEENPTENSRPIIYERKKQFFTFNGGHVSIIFGEKYGYFFEFQSASDNDISLFRSLKDLNESFQVYPGGGVSNDEYFFRLQDIYLVNYTNEFSPSLRRGLFNIGQNINLTLREV